MSSIVAPGSDKHAGEQNLEEIMDKLAQAEQAKRLLEAILFSSKEPLSLADLSEAVESSVDVLKVLKELQSDYNDRGIVLENNGVLWAFRTASDLAARLTIVREESKKLSRAALETLAIIAYHQPVTRAEIEDIRGVAVAKGTVDTLLELNWIRPKGRKRAPGRPLMWGTTEAFLDHFGLADLDQLPGVKELKDSGLLDRAPSLEEFEAMDESAAIDRDPEDELVADASGLDPEDELGANASGLDPEPSSGADQEGKSNVVHMKLSAENELSS